MGNALEEERPDDYLTRLAMSDLGRSYKSHVVRELDVRLESDWETLVVDHPDPEIPTAYRRFVTDRVVRNSRIGPQLPDLCEDSRLTVTQVSPVTAVFRDVAEADRLFASITLFLTLAGPD
jgi:hypothetical protein